MAAREAFEHEVDLGRKLALNANGHPPALDFALGVSMVMTDFPERFLAQH